MARVQTQAKANYILGIDGGGTKTIARLVNLKSKEQWQAKAGSSSLSNNFTGAVDVLENLLNELTNKSLCQLNELAAVFGLAGAGNAVLVARLAKHFAARFAALNICSDAKTSAFGANRGDDVAVVALGTGSVGLRLQTDEKGFVTDTIVGGWGFVIGDEGGGAKLGYHAVQAIIREVQASGVCQSELACAVYQRIITYANVNSRTAILSWLSSATPVDFAQLSPIVFSHQDNCPVAQRLLAQHCQYVETLISDTRGKTNLPVVLLGGLAEPTQKLLSKATQACLLPAKGNALDGACLIAQQLV